jgi:hypothetical protein
MLAHTSNPDNAFEGIVYYPIANKYAATIGSGKKTRVLSFHKGLDEAIRARRAAIEERKPNAS